MLNARWDDTGPFIYRGYGTWKINQSLTKYTLGKKYVDSINALNTIGNDRNLHFRHKVNKNVTAQTYIEFELSRYEEVIPVTNPPPVITPGIYVLKAGTEYYEENLETLNFAFGGCKKNGTGYLCDHVKKWRVEIYPTGAMMVSRDNGSCNLAMIMGEFEIAGVSMRLSNTTPPTSSRGLAMCRTIG